MIFCQKFKTLTVLQFLFGAVIAQIGYGQTNPPSNSADFECKVCLKEVHFGGTLNSVYIPILDDETDAEFMAPHYRLDCGSDVPSVQHPVAYVSNNRAKVKAIIETECDKEIFVRGVAQYALANGSIQNLEFAEQKCAASGNLHTYDFRNANIKFEKNVVRYLPKFEIRWEYRYDQNSQWTYFGSSFNTIYVTHRKPVVLTRDLGGLFTDYTRVFHTLIDLGCRGADRISNRDQIVDKCFTEFRTRNIKRVDGIGPIQYWRTLEDISGHPYWTPSGMLKATNLQGRCGGWSAFYQDVVAIQGIHNAYIFEVKRKDAIINSGNYVITPLQYSKFLSDYSAFFDNQIAIGLHDYSFIPVGVIGNLSSQFMIQDWQLGDEKFVVEELNNYLTLNALSPEPEPVVGQMNQKIKMLFRNGLPGQGKDNPRSEFDNHAFVIYKNTVYDPSYGTSFVDKEAWETASVAALHANFLLKYKGAGGIEKYIWVNWIESKEIPSELDLNYE